MKHDKLNHAMEQISDRYLMEAAEPKKKSLIPYFAATAAILVLGLLSGMLLPGLYAAETPLSTLSPNIQNTVPHEPAPPADPIVVLSDMPGSVELLGLVAAPEYPKMEAYPEDPNDYDQYKRWSASQDAQYDQPEGYADSLRTFWTESLPLLLSGSEENAVCSPVNIYSALAMLAECTGGTSRQQILDLLGADSIEALRQQAEHVWNAHYCFDGKSTSILGSSLWLDDNCMYDADTVSILSGRHHASVFQGQLGSTEMNKALQDWLNDQTGGLLKEQAQKQTISEDTILALATTIFYRVGWNGGFSESRSTTETFHAPTGDIAWAFMHKTISQGTYYPGDGYGAVALPLEDGSRMWLVLPDEGETPQTLLEDGNALALILKGACRDAISIEINLSMPRFDICAETDLIPVLKTLGITDAFSETNADFTALLPGSRDPIYNVFLGKADHAARVAVDEEGVAAAAYTVMLTYATSAPMLPDDEIDFILDRPFLFVITSRDGLPLFAGIVNQP